MSRDLRRWRALVWLLSIALALGGAAVALRMPSSIYPEVDFPRIVVVAHSGDAPADDTRLALTRPLEEALATVQGLQRIQAETIRGAAELSLQFAPGTDMWRALQLVQSQVADARADLPGDAQVVVERLTTTSFPVVTFNVTGTVDPRDLRDAARFVLVPAASRVPGVGRVELLGGEEREFEVILAPEQAAALRLTPKAVADTVRAQSAFRAVGWFARDRAQVTVVASAEPDDLADLGTLPVLVAPDGNPVPLSSIATIVEGAADSLVLVSGPAGPTVQLSVSRLPGASTPGVVSAVQRAIAEAARTLPAGIEVRPVYDQAELVSDSIRSVRDAILLGIALAIAVITGFLRDVRGGLVAALAVPLTLFATFLPMALLGHTLNLMSLGGLAVAIGLVVDDAIVVVEAVRRKVEGGRPPHVAAQEAVGALRPALLGTTATTIVVFLPLVWLQGFVGRFFAALAVTLASAVALSLAAAVTIVPLAAGDWMRARPAGRRPWYLATYAHVVGPLLRRPLIGLALAVLLLVLGAAASRLVRTGFLPAMDEGAFVVDYFLPAGTSLGETDAVARRIEAVLASLPEVTTFTRRTGAELGPAAATQVNSGDIMVRLAARAERHRGTQEIIEEARARIEERVPEARVEFVQVLQDILNDLSGVPRPIEIRIFGEDYAVLRSLSADAVARIGGLPGLVDLDPGFEGFAPELRLRIDRDEAARLGITATDIADDLDAALHGTIASSIRLPDRLVDVRVRYPDAVRFDPRGVETLPILGSKAGTTSLSAVARLVTEPVAASLRSESLQPVVVVSADVSGTDARSVLREARRRLEGIRLPPGYRFAYGGQAEAQGRTLRAFAAVFAAGVLAVLVVLLAQFRRSRLALAVLASVPLAVVGALWALVLAGLPLDASSLMGCVLLVGLVVKNGILLLEQTEVLLDRGADLERALREAGEIRVRPILMTTVATIAGLFPLALGLGAGAEILRPLAICVIGGLVLSSVISLIVIPSLVRLLFRRAHT